LGSGYKRYNRRHADALSEDDALQTKTNEVTDALRRTTTLMQAELERSVLSVQMLGAAMTLVFIWAALALL
jgi:hypothetical protein